MWSFLDLKVLAVGAAARRARDARRATIKASQGARRSSWPGRWEGLVARCAVPCHNKGFARRPQDFLAWQVGGRLGRQPVRLSRPVGGALPPMMGKDVQVGRGAVARPATNPERPRAPIMVRPWLGRALHHAAVQAAASSDVLPAAKAQILHRSGLKAESDSSQLHRGIGG